MVAAQTALARRPRQARTRSLTTIVLLAFLVYFLLPLFWVIVSATKSNQDLLSTFGLWFAPDFNLIANLRDVFSHGDGVYLRWLGNTAYYSVVSAVGAALVATIGGYAFAKFRFRGRDALFALILGSIMVPSTALVIPTYLLLSKVHLTDTPLAVILPSLLSPFGLYLMTPPASTALVSCASSGGSRSGSWSPASSRSCCSSSWRPGTTTSCRWWC